MPVSPEEVLKKSINDYQCQSEREREACDHLSNLLDPDNQAVTELDYDRYPCLWEGNLGEVVSPYIAPISSFKIDGEGVLTKYIKTIHSIVYIPSSVTSIGDSVFKGCSSLTSVAIPDSVTSIGRNAFYDCTGLASIVIPAGVTLIGQDAFYNCDGLKSVEIPNRVTSIEYGAISNCVRLKSVVIMGRVTSIGRFAFSNCRTLTSVEIPDCVTSIGRAAFSRCINLKYFIIKGDDPDRLLKILKARNDISADVVIMNSRYEVLHPAGVAFEKPEGFDAMHKAQKRAHVHAHFAPASIDSMSSVIQPYMRTHYPDHVVIFNRFPDHLKNIVSMTVQTKEMVKTLLLSAYRVRLRDPNTGQLVHFLGAIPPEIWLTIIDCLFGKPVVLSITKQTGDDVVPSVTSIALSPSSAGFFESCKTAREENRRIEAVNDAGADDQAPANGAAAP